jgi:MraZ protein
MKPTKLALQGRVHIKIDPKGRLHLPAKFKSALTRQTQLVITNSVHAGQRFLDVYPMANWQKLVGQISALPQLRTEVQTFQRYYIASGEVVDLDSQGRFLIPSHFREFARLREDTVLIGVGNKMEIWSEPNWATLMTETESKFDDVVRTIADLAEKSPQKGRSK